MAKSRDINQLKKQLQDLIGDEPVVKVEHLVNWSHSTDIKNLLAVCPKTLSEVQSVVKAAKTLKLQVRCVGSGHSWGPLFPDEGNVLIKTEELHRDSGADIQLVQSTEYGTCVNVMTSTTVEELMDFELANNVNLPSNVILTKVTCGGLVATGCHGVGYDYKSLSDICVKMRIVDSFGKLRTFTKSADADMMAAVQCNLGMFGVIYDLQLQVIPKRIAHAVNQYTYNIKELFYDPGNLKTLVEGNDSVEIFYWPYNSVSGFEAVKQYWNANLTKDEWSPKKDACWVRKVNVLPEGSTHKVTGKLYYKILDVQTYLEGFIIDNTDKFIVKFPKALTTTFMKASWEYLKYGNKCYENVYQELPHAIHFRPNVDMYSVNDMEWAFDNTADFSNVQHAVQAVIEILQDDATQGCFPLNVAIEMRFIKHSDSYLCPAIVGSPTLNGSGHTVYVEVLSFSGTKGWDAFCNKVADKWKKIPGARPHWAKQWAQLDDIDDYMREVWSDQMTDFRSALKRSGCDPTGMFLNNRLRQLFYPPTKMIRKGKKIEGGPPQKKQRI